MRVPAALSGLAGAAVLAGVATPLHDQPGPIPTTEEVNRLEAKLALRIAYGIEGVLAPPGAPQVPRDRARPLDEYVRHYVFVSLRSEEDLPFTTIGPPEPGQANNFTGRRIAGVLVLGTVLQRPAGVVRTHRRDALPEVYHQGCAVVNVVYDPATDRLVSAWCNVS